MKRLLYFTVLFTVFTAALVHYFSPPQEASNAPDTTVQPIVEVRLSGGAEVVMDVSPGAATIAPAQGLYSGRYNVPPQAPDVQPQEASIMATPVYFQAKPGSPTATLVQNPTTGEITIEPTPQKGSTIVEWFRWFWDNWENFAAVLLALIMAIEPIVRWTPTEKDNNLLRTISSWLDRIIPNRRAGGGTFTTFRSPEETPGIAAPPKRE